jgi:hypothetical protein
MEIEKPDLPFPEDAADRLAAKTARRICQGRPAWGAGALRGGIEAIEEPLVSRDA